MDPKIRVLLAEDHTIVREGIRSLLENSGQVEVVGETENGRSAVALARELKPDVAIVDVSMPELDGIEATRQIKSSDPEIQIIVLTMFEEQARVKQAFRSGASAYLVKKNAIQELLAALDAVMKNEMYLSPTISKVVIDGFVGDGAEAKGSQVRDHLSNRERQVLTRVAEGATNKEAAQELNISEKTVAAHRASLMRKLRLKNVSDLVRFAIREGYVKLNQDDMNESPLKTPIFKKIGQLGEIPINKNNNLQR